MLQTCRRYSIQALQDEARALVSRGSVGRKTQLYSLSKYFENEEWDAVELLLESHGYLLRDSICDLIGKESWLND